MNLEEARAVLWLRNNHRPLGELLDEGYLNETRLAWAAEKAYDAQLKTAAGVLLEWLRRHKTATAPAQPIPSPVSPKPSLPTVEAGITLEQARRTAWPFGPHKGQPIGDLVDTRQLSLKDLAYAVENAWDMRARQAAIVLLAERLNQEVHEPLPSAGLLKVVSGGRSYSQSKELRWMFLSGMFMGALLLGWVQLVIFTVRSLSKSISNLKFPTTPVEIIAVTLVIGIMVVIFKSFDYVFDSVDKKVTTEIDSARKGQEGEEAVLETLRQNLDGNWTLFRNLTLPGKNKADMDAVLVGPPGVWVLEIKNFTGEYRNFGEHWEIQVGNRPKLLKKSPSRQAQNNAVRLSGFLKADGIQQYVDKAVVWANRESLLTVEHPAVPVWTLETLPEELGNLWQGRTMNEATQTRIVEKLTDLCEKQNRTQERK